MRIIKGAVAFVVVFCMLAATVVCAAVVTDKTEVDTVPQSEQLCTDTMTETQNKSQEETQSSEECTETADESVKETVAPTHEVIKDDTLIPDAILNKSDISMQGATAYTPRLTAPAKTNKYYYSNINIYYKYGYGMPNCTCYAYGRAYEILKTEPKLCPYNAEEWFGYNKTNKYYKYGTTPKLGAIACWKYKDGSGGHVAVVEKITSTTITYSNSAWSGSTFYVDTTPVNDPTGGRSNWQFQGFIYIGDFATDTPSEPEVKGDVYKITDKDGVNMRSGAGTSYSVVGAIPYNASVTVTKTKSANGYKWGYTTYDGVTGWFATDFAKLVSSSGDTTPTQPPTQPQKVIGDVDLDGNLSVFDATYIQMADVGRMTLTSEQSALADFDKDGYVTIMDSTAIRLKLVGK